MPAFPPQIHRPCPQESSSEPAPATRLSWRGVASVSALALAASVGATVPSVLLAPPAAAEPTSTPRTTVTSVGVPTASASQKSADRTARRTTTSSTDGSAGSTREANLLASLPAQDTKRFSTVGVTWTPTSGTTSVTVEVRTLSVDTDAWSGWTALETGDEVPEGATRAGTDPVYVGESDGVEVRVTSAATRATLPDLQVDLVDSPEVAADARPMTTAASTTAASPSLPYLYPQPAVVSRKGWGADESWRKINGADCAIPMIDDTIQAAVVHHTAGSNSYSASSVPSIMRGMYAYHVKTQGWCDIGYNFVVDKYGKIWEGRAGGVTLPVHGAHATSWNTNTVGISMIGNYETATPSSAAMESLAKLIAWKLEGNYRSPTSKVTLAGQTEYRIFGHGDVMGTACPGKNLRSRLPALRSTVASKIGSYNTPIYQRWQALGGESGKLGSPHVGEVAVAGGRYTQFEGGAIAYSSSTGARALIGSIGTKYKAVGGPSSYLKFPTGEVKAGRTSGTTTATFQSGAIYSSSRTGTDQVYRAFYSTYRALGEDSGRLGLPQADQKAGPTTGSQIQQFTGGWLVWNSKVGPQTMWGGIANTWMGLSTSGKGLVGLPTAGETTLTGHSTKAWRQPFEHGYVYYAGKGLYLHSAVADRYRTEGLDGGRLGLPTRSNYWYDKTNRIEAADFEHGRITWNHATGATTVTTF